MVCCFAYACWGLCTQLELHRRLGKAVRQLNESWAQCGFYVNKVGSCLYWQAAEEQEWQKDLSLSVCFAFTMARLDSAADNDPEMGEGSSYCWQPSLTAKNIVSSSFLDAAEMASLALCLGPVTHISAQRVRWMNKTWLVQRAAALFSALGPFGRHLNWSEDVRIGPCSSIRSSGELQEVDKRKSSHLGSMQVTKNSKWIFSLSIQSCHLSWFLIPSSLFAYPQTLEVPIIISVQVFLLCKSRIYRKH